MAPIKPKAKKGKGRGQNTGPGGQPSSSLASGQVAGEPSAPAMPNYQTPTVSSLAHQGGPVTRDDVDMSEPASLVDPVTRDHDQEMTDVPPPAHLATLPTPMAPMPTTPAPEPASADQTMQVGSLLEDLPTVELSREELTRLKMARIQARMEVVMKRPLPEITADSQPSAAKRQQTQKPDDHEAVQGRIVVRQPFPYTEVGNTRRSFSFLRVRGGSIIGSLQRQNGWGIKFSMDAGTCGVHAFEISLLCNVFDKSIPLRDVNPVPGELDIIPMAWYTGARADADSDKGPYQLEDFEIFCVQDHPGHQAANERSVLEACPAQKRHQLAYCRFKSNQTYYTDGLGGSEAWKDIDKRFRDVFKKLMRGDGNYVEIWFIHPFGSSSPFEETVLMPFRRAYEERLPLLSQYDVLDLEGTPSIKDIGRGMFCVYPTKPVPGSKKRLQDQSGGPIRFNKLATPNVYNFRREFEIYHALLPIREAQYQKGLAVHVESNAVRVYLMSLTGIEIKDRAQFDLMTPAQRRVHKTFYAFIRMPGKKGQKELAPAPGIRIQLEWDNSDARRQKPHAPIKSSYRWKGVVIAHQGAAVAATGTDYCVLLTMPNGIPGVPFRPFSEPKFLPSVALPLAHLIAKFNNQTYERELEAIKAFCNSGRPQITSMQRVLSSNSYVDDNQVDVINVAAGPHPSKENEEKYKELVDRFERDNILDGSQITALREAAKAPNYTRIVQGPPGTGKTRTAVHLAWALVNAGHKVLFVAPTNVAVDSATTALMRSRPADMAHHKVIRVEATSLSMSEITKYVDYDEMERYDQPGIVKPQPASAADPVLATLIDEFEASLDVQADVDFEKYLANTQNFEKAYELALNAYKDRAQDYPVEASLDFNVWRTCKEDFDSAAKGARQKQLMTPRNITELITSEETESSEYSKAVQNYINLEGAPNAAASKSFMKLRVQQEGRNISNASIICTTASNAAADILTAKFNPTVIILDEVGQMTAPALAVPLMAYRNWVCSYEFGDPKQLQPLLTGQRLCEVSGVVENSVLGVYIDRKYPLLFLANQYRMDPEIASFPSQLFYDNKLKNAASTAVDNEYKQAIRRVTSKYYGIKGKDGNGSVYMMVDVIHGRGRLEEGGTSLQNYANADAIVEAIKHLIDEGFPRSEIKLLTLYKGQKSVLVSKLSEGPEGDHWVPQDVTTVDSYQGKQAAFACLDLVAASQVEEGKLPGALMDEEAVATAPMNVDSATSYVTNPHRLCVGLTRTTCGLFTFCQTATLVRAFKSQRSDYQNAVTKMVENAQERGLVYRDTVHVDTHPVALREVANLDAFHTRALRKKQDEQQFLFVEKIMRKAQTQKHERAQKHSALQKIPEPKLAAPTPSRRAPHLLPARPATGSSIPEPTTAPPATDEGGVSITDRPVTQRDQKKQKKSLRDKAIAAQLAEEERTGKKKPEVIPNPNIEKESWANMMQEEVEEAEVEEAEEGQRKEDSEDNEMFQPAME